MKSSRRRHLVAVWNPVFAPSAMEQHIRVLQDAARKFRHGKARADEVYVWWGKLRSVNRLEPLPHLDDVLAIETEQGRDDEGPETHLYLTDYASLYVAHLGGSRRRGGIPSRRLSIRSWPGSGALPASAIAGSSSGISGGWWTTTPPKRRTS
jgi:hypothetical protein